MASFLHFTFIFLITILTSISAINTTSKSSFKFSSPPSSSSPSITNAMIELKRTGYKTVAFAMQLNYAELIDLNNMTIFALDDLSIIINGAQLTYFENLKFHIIPNRLLKFADLELLEENSLLPTLISGKKLVVTTSRRSGAGTGGGGDFSPLKSTRINYVMIEQPNLIVNHNVVVHGISFPFGQIVVSQSSFLPTTVIEDDDRLLVQTVKGGASKVGYGNIARDEL